MKQLISKMAMVVALMIFSVVTAASAPAQAASAEAGVVNINTANAKQLKLLQGIGAKKAEAIVEYRTKAPFGSVEELVKVKGIGQKLLEKLRPQLTVQGETTLKAKPKARKRKTAKAGG